LSYCLHRVGNLYSSVGADKVRVVLATADTSSLTSSQLDVTSVTPAGAPGVSNDPVVFATLVTITDHSDGVVDLGWAVLVVEDTASVLLERSVSGSESDGNDTSVKGSLMLGDGASGNRFPIADFDFAGVFISARCLSSSVWVLGTLHLTVLFEVAPGVGVEATVATVVSCAAVNELLLREFLEASGSSPVRVLGTSGGTESPAGTA